MQRTSRSDEPNLQPRPAKQSRQPQRQHDLNFAGPVRVEVERHGREQEQQL